LLLAPEVSMCALVTVDYTQRYDQRHSTETDQGKYQPAVLETARDDATQEQRFVTSGPRCSASVGLTDHPFKAVDCRASGIGGSSTTDSAGS
jgi:hypothetical protein